MTELSATGRTASSRDTASSWVADFVRPGDLVVVAQATGEPTTLLEHLVAEAERLEDVEVFVGLSHTGALRDPRASALSLVSFGAMGPLSRFASAGQLAVIPCAFSDVPRLLAQRAPGRLVLALQVAPADARGRHSLGLSVDYTFDLLQEARAVVAEVNDKMPLTTAPHVPAGVIGRAIRSSREVAAPRPARIDQIHRAIAGHVAELVKDDSTVQLGVGSVPSAVGEALTSRRRLRVRSTLVGDWLLPLARAGALIDDPGAVMTSEAAGSSELHAYVARGNVLVRSVAEVTRPDRLAATHRFVSMNAALQVDLTGQVNAEELSTGYVGGVGGQPDFLRAAQRSPEGLSIVMLPSTTSDGETSRIATHLHRGVVTTPRWGADFVVTEHGVADLRGRSLAERAEAIVAIAAPQHRPELRNAIA